VRWSTAYWDIWLVGERPRGSRESDRENSVNSPVKQFIKLSVDIQLCSGAQVIYSESHPHHGSQR